MGNGGANRSTGLDREFTPPLGVQVRMRMLSYGFAGSEHFGNGRGSVRRPSPPSFAGAGHLLRDELGMAAGAAARRATPGLPTEPLRATVVFSDAARVAVSCYESAAASKIDSALAPQAAFCDEMRPARALFLHGGFLRSRSCRQKRFFPEATCARMRWAGFRSPEFSGSLLRGKF